MLLRYAEVLYKRDTGTAVLPESAHAVLSHYTAGM